MEPRGTRTPAAAYLPLWERALTEEIGVCIECTDRAKLVAGLYDARAESNDPRLEALMIFQPKEGLVYIAKKSVELEP